MEYAVLGGGALGLTVALRLAQGGEKVVVYEKEPEPGGLASGFQIDEVWLEKFYHHLFRSDRSIARLIKELGLEEKLVWRRPKTVVLWNGGVHQLDSPSSLLKFAPLSIIDRIRLGAVLAYLKVVPSDWLEGKKASAWIRRMAGEGPYQVIWGPMLSSKFGAVKEEIAMPWLRARVSDRSSELGYLRGGFQQFYNCLAEEIRRLGGQLEFGALVKEVRIGPNDRLTVDSSAGEHSFDRIISTLPVALTCRLVPELPDAYKERYNWGKAYGAHCVILALKHRMTDSYWTNINDPGYPFMVLVEHTNYMATQDYGGRHMVYLGNYRPMDDPLFSKSKDEVLAEFAPHLSRINSAFTPEWITESWMYAAPFAQPIVTVDYKEHIPPFDTSVPGLYVASMFQVYPHDRGQNYSVELAERLIEHLKVKDSGR
ncbi:MAG: NAD(P)/FAD-dependent oxidoreductase [Dehalococcoidia bacterium]|nr:NAD(P)/FAD-dependent oxidoreductase [Dehalococcoidia bacterium]